MCKTVNDKVVVDVDDKALPAPHHKDFDGYHLWGDELGPEYKYRDDVGMFFRNEYYGTDVMPLFSLKCGVGDCDFTNEVDTFVSTAEDPDDPNAKAKQKKEKKRLGGMKALNEHLRSKHNMTLCHLCVGAKRDFVSRLPRFAPGQLKAHQSRGDGGASGFAGHPLCEFCRPRRFYDLGKLHEHLNKDHYKCHICDHQGKPNQFFKNYDKLALHFDREHFLCADPQCLAARFVVFENEIDLRAHEVNTHSGGGRNGDTKIQLEFRVRRTGYDGSGRESRQEIPTEGDFGYGLDGEAFVPAALPQSQENEPTISDPTHAARTAALRAEAARVREENAAREEEEAFPSLGGSTPAAGTAGGGGGGSMIGWTAAARPGAQEGNRRGGRMTTEDFPSLPAPSKKKSVAAKAKARAPQKTLNGQFAAMMTAASGSGPPAPAHAAPGVSWAGSAASRPSAPVPSAAAAAPSYGTAVPRNRASDLTADNFPSLGPPSNAGVSSKSNIPGKRAKQPPTTRYAAAEALARKNRLKKKHESAAPSSAALANVLDFPPPSSSTSNNDKKKPAAAAARAPPPNDVLNFPPPPGGASLVTGHAAIDSMKATLGPIKYKQLKNLTKQFGAGEIEPETYVDSALGLFDGGIKDGDFWSFVPSLIMSCPNSAVSNGAMRHLDSLRLANEMLEEELERDGGSGGAEDAGGWASAAAAYVPPQATPTLSHSADPPPAHSTAAASYGARTAAAPTTRYVLPTASKKKSAWNGSKGSATASKVASASLVSVSAAAAQETPRTGTATKYMAQARAEERKAKQVESQAKQGGGQGKKAKQKKKNDELRSLAFGGGK